VSRIGDARAADLWLHQEVASDLLNQERAVSAMSPVRLDLDRLGAALFLVVEMRPCVAWDPAVSHCPVADPAEPRSARPGLEASAGDSID